MKTTRTVTALVTTALLASAAVLHTGLAAHAGEPGDPEPEHVKVDRTQQMIDDLLRGRERASGPDRRIVHLTGPSRHAAMHGGYHHGAHNRVVADFNRAIDIRVAFETGEAGITDEAEPILTDLARAIRAHPLRDRAFIIGGHTDSAGSEASNIALSIARAHAVKRYLVEVHGIEPYRLIPVGFGESRPYDAKNPAASVNRRIEVISVEGHGTLALAKIHYAGAPWPAICGRIAGAIHDPRPYHTGLDDYGGVRTPAPCHVKYVSTKTIEH